MQQEPLQELSSLVGQQLHKMSCSYKKQSVWRPKMKESASWITKLKIYEINVIIDVNIVWYTMLTE